MSQNLDKLFGGLQTLPGLIGDLALSIAEAQTRLDENYMKSLAEFMKTVAPLINRTTGDESRQFQELFKAIAPSRYQFTETVVEVRADLQVTSASQTQVDANVGVTNKVFAATVNFSYLKRTASDYRAAALVRTTLNAIPAASETLLGQLLARGGDPPSTTTPDRQGQFAGLADAFRGLLPSGQAGGGGNQPGGGGASGGGASGGGAASGGGGNK
ncbi:MAG TPA: hypothetical protein VER08_11950 [Pyrinomonadaceae bacterium]|nr:hypothetical protein [Pyrinomonadaceae bacterium]